MRHCLVLAGASVLLLTGCAGVAVTGAAVPGGLKAVGIAPTRAELLSFAEEQLTAACMRERGFAYDVPPAPDREPVDHGPEFAYGIDDTGWAAEHGFGLAVGAGGAQPVDPDRPAAPEQDTEGFQLALFGSENSAVSVELYNGDVMSASADSCLAQAKTGLYGDFARYFALDVVIRHLRPEVQTRVVADPRFRAATTAWSTCMTAAGLLAADPGDLRERFGAVAEETDPDDLDSLERTWAVAEAHCVISSDLATTGRELEAEHGAAVRAERAAEIAELEELRSAAAVRARDLTTA